MATISSPPTTAVADGGPQSLAASQASSANLSPVSPLMDGLLAAQHALDQGNADKAAQLLSRLPTSLEVRHAQAVCLMHQGRVAEGLVAFRKFMFQAHCVWVNPELPTLYKVNFAIALLLNGHPAGCLTLLQEINEESHPGIRLIRQAFRRWEQDLSWWGWWNWKLMGVDPTDQRFVPFPHPRGWIVEPATF